MATVEINQHFLNQIRKLVGSNLPPAAINEFVFRLTLQLQEYLVQFRLLGVKGSGVATVFQGPFKGMEFTYPVVEGALLPKAIGSYEQELHPYLLEASKKGYTHFVDIGCADGFYAVGMARLMPHLFVEAYDSNEKARIRCKENADLNHVSDRMAFLGAFTGEQFEKFPKGKTLVLCDIDGGEETLLDPTKYPALKALDIIVELHEVFHPGISQRVTDKFANTHHIVLIEQNGKQIQLPEQMKSAPELTRMLLTYEMRAGPTPWAVMTVKE